MFDTTSDTASDKALDFPKLLHMKPPLNGIT